MSQSPLVLAQTITERTEQGEIGSVEIAEATYTDGELSVTLNIDPEGPVLFNKEDFDGLTREVRMVDRTRGVEVAQDFNIERKQDTPLNNTPLTHTVSAPVPDGSEVEIIYNQEETGVFDTGDAVPAIIRREGNVSVFVEVGDPDEEPEIRAQVGDPETGVTMTVWRAVQDGDAGAVEVEVTAPDQTLPGAGGNGFVRVASGEDINDVVSRKSLGEIPRGGSTTLTPTFKKSVGESAVTVSVVHPAIPGDMTATIDLRQGTVSGPVSQLEVTEFSAGQMAEQRAIEASYTLQNTTVSGAGEVQSGLLEFFVRVDPDLQQDPGTDADALAERSVTLQPGDQQQATVQIRNELIPVGDYEICARVV
jgi:hypothetical protein